MVNDHRSFWKPSEKVESCKDSRATEKKHDWDATGDAIIGTRYYRDSHPAVVCERPKFDYLQRTLEATRCPRQSLLKSYQLNIASIQLVILEYGVEGKW
jgi:hypothetical protein